MNCPKCNRGMSSSKRCLYCAEDAERQSEADERLAEALERLADSGRLGQILRRVR